MLLANSNFGLGDAAEILAAAVLVVDLAGNTSLLWALAVAPLFSLGAFATAWLAMGAAIRFKRKREERTRSQNGQSAP